MGFSYEGIIERQSPFRMILTTQDLIRKIGKDTHKIQMHHTERLVSRPDLYVILKYLAVLPYGNLNTSSKDYKELLKNLNH